MVSAVLIAFLQHEAWGWGMVHSLQPAAYGDSKYPIRLLFSRPLHLGSRLWKPRPETRVPNPEPITTAYSLVSSFHVHDVRCSSNRRRAQWSRVCGLSGCGRP